MDSDRGVIRLKNENVGGVRRGCGVKAAADMDKLGGGGGMGAGLRKTRLGGCGGKCVSGGEVHGGHGGNGGRDGGIRGSNGSWCNGSGGDWGDDGHGGDGGGVGVCESGGDGCRRVRGDIPASLRRACSRCARCRVCARAPVCIGRKKKKRHH